MMSGKNVTLMGRAKTCQGSLKYLNRILETYVGRNILAQRRKGAKKAIRNAVALCAFASLRESSSYQVLSCKPIGDVGFSKTFAVLLGLTHLKRVWIFFRNIGNKRGGKVV